MSVKDTLPPGASLLSGSLDVEFPVLASGSSVNHSYVMTFAAGGSGLVLPVASVTYDAEEGTQQVCILCWVHAVDAGRGMGGLHGHGSLTAASKRMVSSAMRY